MSTKRKTLEEFVRDARKVHGDTYDYSLIKVAQEYFDNGMITEEVYAALMKYEVEITD